MGGGTGGSVPELGESEDTPEMGESEDTPRIGRSEDAGLGSAAGAPCSPGPKGLQPMDRMERPEDGGRAQNAGGPEAPSVKDVLTLVLQVPSATAEARYETQDAGTGSGRKA